MNALGTDGKVPFAYSFDVCQINASDRFLNPFMPIIEIASSWLQPWKTSIKGHLKIIDDFANQVIDKRRKEIAAGGHFEDLLSRFMNAKNEHGEELSNKEVKQHGAREDKQFF